MTLLYSAVCTECSITFACEWIEGEERSITCSKECEKAREERLECDSGGLGYLNHSQGEQEMVEPSAAATCSECGVEFILKKSGRRNKTCSRECSRARNRAMVKLKRTKNAEAAKKGALLPRDDASDGGSESSEDVDSKVNSETRNGLVVASPYDRQGAHRRLPKGSPETSLGSQSTLRGPFEVEGGARQSIAQDGSAHEESSARIKRDRQCSCVSCVKNAELESDKRAGKIVPQGRFVCLIGGLEQRAKNGNAATKQQIFSPPEGDRTCEACGASLRDGSRWGRDHKRFCSNRCKSVHIKGKGEAGSGPEPGEQAQAKQTIGRREHNESSRVQQIQTQDEMPTHSSPPEADICSDERTVLGHNVSHSLPTSAGGTNPGQLASIDYRNLPANNQPEGGCDPHEVPLEWIKSEFERLKALHRELQRAAHKNGEEFSAQLEELRKERDYYKASAASGEKYKSLYLAQRVVTEGQRRVIQELTQDMT